MIYKLLQIILPFAKQCNKRIAESVYHSSSFWWDSMIIHNKEQINSITLMSQVEQMWSQKISTKYTHFEVFFELDLGKNAEVSS